MRVRPAHHRERRHIQADVPQESWNLPVFGEVPACDAVVVRPDGYIAWVNPAG